HRVDDVDERLVAREEAVPAGQQIALEPALAGVFGEDLHDPSARLELAVVRAALADPAAAGDLEPRPEPVRFRLLRAEHAEVAALLVALHHVAQVRAEGPGAFGIDRPGRRYLDGVAAEIGQAQIAQQNATVGVRVHPHAALTPRAQRQERVHRRAV